MVIYNELKEINKMIDRLVGFTENQISLIKLIAKQSFTTGNKYNNYQDEMVKLKIRINDLQRISDSQSKARTNVITIK